MLRQDLERLLEKGEALDNVLGIPCGRDASGKRRDITLRLCKVDSPNLYSPQALSEMSRYIARQRIIAENPYELIFADTLGAGDGIESVYVRDLEAVDAFLKQRGKSLEDVEQLLDFWEP